MVDVALHDILVSCLQLGLLPIQNLGLRVRPRASLLMIQGSLPYPGFRVSGYRFRISGFRFPV